MKEKHLTIRASLAPVTQYFLWLIFLSVSSSVSYFAKQIIGIPILQISERLKLNNIYKEILHYVIVYGEPIITTPIRSVSYQILLQRARNQEVFIIWMSWTSRNVDQYLLTICEVQTLKFNVALFHIPYVYRWKKWMVNSIYMPHLWLFLGWT